MTEIIYMIIALIAGLIIGAFFFGGLWFTVKKALSSQRPALWFIGSFIVRVGFTLAGFYLVAQTDLKKVLICLLGFMAARFVVTRITKQHESSQLKKEVRNEA